MLLPQSDARAFIVRFVVEEDSGVAEHLEVVTVNDGGDCLSGAAAVDPQQRAVLCLSQRASAASASTLTFFVDDDDGGATYPSAVHVETCRELVLLDGGVVAYLLDEQTPLNPRSPRSRFAKFGAGYQLENEVSLDAGFCALDRQGNGPLGAWCDSNDSMTLLRFDDVMHPVAAVALTGHGPLIVVGLVDGHLLVATNLIARADGRTVGSLEWLENGAFRPVAQGSVILPVGFGPWTAGSGLVSHDADDGGLELTEMFFGNCPSP